MGTTAAMEKKFDAVESMLAWLHSECQFSHDALASKKHGLVCLASQQPVNWHENITVGSGPVYGGPVFFGSHMAVARWIWKRLHSDSNLEEAKFSSTVVQHSRLVHHSPVQEQIRDPVSHQEQKR